MDTIDNHDCASCNCVEIGTVVSDKDTQLVLTLSGDTIDQQLDNIKTRAESIGSGNCQITTHTKEDTTDVILDFDCAVEKMIFQMRNQ